jgi:hypothetical protein
MPDGDGTTTKTRSVSRPFVAGVLTWIVIMVSFDLVQWAQHGFTIPHIQIIDLSTE